MMRALRKAWLIRNSSKRVMDYNFGCVCSNFDPPNRSYTSSIKKHILNHEINQYCILFIYDNHMFCIHYYRENYTINEWCLCLDDYWWLLMILDDSWCLCLEIHSSLTFSSKDKPSPNRHGINWSPLIHIDYGDPFRIQTLRYIKIPSPNRPAPPIRKARSVRSTPVIVASCWRSAPRPRSPFAMDPEVQVWCWRGGGWPGHFRRIHQKMMIFMID